MTNAEVVKRYAAQQTNRQQKGVHWASRSLTARDRVLSSYVWPIAYYLPPAVKREDTLSPAVFLKRGDTYSRTTSRHQGLLQQECTGPTVSFNALEAAGVRVGDLTSSNLIGWNKDERISLSRADKDSPWERSEWSPDEGKYVHSAWTRPNVGMFMPWGYAPDEGRETTSWHILGAALFKVDKRYLLASMDERMYFVSELAKPARTVQSAFNQLKPRRVQLAERKGVKVKRQGEWFFIPSTMTTKRLAAGYGVSVTTFEHSWSTVTALPNRQRGNEHQCRYVVGPDGHYYAKGNVYHRTPPTRYHPQGLLTHEHSTLHLGDVWHQIHRNTERMSWSQSGKFD